jgi:GT2 family glycosyltransferase
MSLSFSIVIPSCNRADVLRACLLSIETHAPRGTEVVVVDDGSPGETVTRVARSFRSVRSIRKEKRSGFCAAANSGVAVVKGDIVELLNDDTEVTGGWADAGLSVFHNARVGAVAPLVLDRQTDGAGEVRIDSAGDRYYLGGVAAKRGHGARLGADYLRPTRVFGASASSAFYRRTALRRVGGFPESFGAYFEDIDLAFRLNRAGYEVRYEPGSRVTHRGGASYGRPRRQLLEQQSYNEERVFWRNIPSAELSGALPRHAAVLLAKAWRRWTEGRLTPFLCGRLRVLGDIGPLLRYRRWLHSLGPPDHIDRWQIERSYWD